jgi:glucose-1-phosphate adenylyltransferase
MAGGNGTRLGALTRWDCKPALPFGGQYRNIDFPLSNCINSGIRRIGVLTQYKAHSLIQHVVHGWSFLRPELNEYVELWPAQQRKGQRWYAGTADAVYQNIEMIMERAPEYVLVLAGDHVYKMDYRPMIEAHAASGAEATVGCIEVPVAEAGEFGVMGVDSRGWVEEFQEKPASPKALPDRQDVALGSMGIYVFNRDFLFDALTRDACDASSSHDFGKNVLPPMVRDGLVIAHAFRDAGGGHTYWRDVGTLDSYWRANLDLLEDEPALDLADAAWPLWTHQPARSPARFVMGGAATSSIVAPACIVAGRVHRSVLFADCSIEKGASLEGCLILPGARIGRGARLRNVIVDSGCVIPDGYVFDAESSTASQHDSGERVVLLTAEALDDAEGAVRRAGVKAAA